MLQPVLTGNRKVRNTTGKPTNNPQQTIETYRKMSPQKLF